VGRASDAFAPLVRFAGPTPPGDPRLRVCIAESDQILGAASFLLHRKLRRLWGA